MGSLANLMNYDLQLNNKYKLSFEDNPDLDYFIKNMNLPMEGLSQEMLPFGNKRLTGLVPVETVTMEFWETTDFKVYTFFRDWQETIFNFDTKVYKVLDNEDDKYKNATLTFMYSNGFTQEEGKKFYLKKLTPLTINEYTLDEESGEPISTIVTLGVNTISTHGETSGYRGGSGQTGITL